MSIIARLLQEAEDSPSDGWAAVERNCSVWEQPWHRGWCSPQVVHHTTSTNSCQVRVELPLIAHCAGKRDHIDCHPPKRQVCALSRLWTVHGVSSVHALWFLHRMVTKRHQRPGKATQGLGARQVLPKAQENPQPAGSTRQASAPFDKPRSARVCGRRNRPEVGWFLPLLRDRTS